MTGYSRQCRTYYLLSSSQSFLSSPKIKPLSSRDNVTVQDSARQCKIVQVYLFCQLSKARENNANQTGKHLRSKRLKWIPEVEIDVTPLLQLPSIACQAREYFHSRWHRSSTGAGSTIATTWAEFNRKALFNFSVYNRNWANHILHLAFYDTIDTILCYTFDVTSFCILFLLYHNTTRTIYRIISFTFMVCYVTFTYSTYVELIFIFNIK